MPTLEHALKMLAAGARPGEIAGMARFGMTPDRRLGLSMPAMRRIAKELGRDHRLALALWNTAIPDARIVASLVAEPAKLTARQMDAWVAGFNSWDVCDQVCGNLFDQSPLAWKKVLDWARRRKEYVRRAAFALIASLAVHDKEAPDERFIALLPVIAAAATDERNFVKKAVNWALRNIGKRNRRLNRAALATARKIGKLDSRAARWVAADAIRELESQAVQDRLRRR